MNKNKIKLITDSTNALCDEMDGLKDGIISTYEWYVTHGAKSVAG